MSEETIREERPRRWWKRVLLPSVGALYGPFFVTAVWTWLFVPCTHCRLVWLKYVWIFPGMMALHLLRVLAQRAGLGRWAFTESVGVAVAVVLSVAMLAGVIWMAGKGRVAWWITLVVVAFLSAWAALGAYFLVRA